MAVTYNVFTGTSNDGNEINKVFKCPYCRADIALDEGSSLSQIQLRHRHIIRAIGIAGIDDRKIITPTLSSRDGGPLVTLRFIHCPRCDKISVVSFVQGIEDTNSVPLPIVPKSLAYKLPNYVPECIRQDYEEAYSIVGFSPRASATLSRRAIQEMIRDKFPDKISSERKNLAQEMDDIQSILSAREKDALVSLRHLGNIGAHPENDIDVIVDIDPSDAQTVLKLIEYFIKKWYVEPHEDDDLLNGITQIDQEKQSERHPNS
ncbi:DUF4145 domain-containing protein [Oenococcus sp.]|uniref:DUF4145 domain-containing protein n=1 Tax=Oenococcus sp. TaxID=1979414 RepID=UPI0039E7322D